MITGLTCVLFDLDNTLTDRLETLRVYAQCFIDDFQAQLAPQVTYEDVHQVMVTGDGGGYRSKAGMFEEIQRDLAWAAAPALEVIAEHWYRVSAACMQVRPGAAETLAILQERGFTLGMITNGRTLVQNATINATGLRGYFATIVISEESGVRKPDPRIFQLALERLGKNAAESVYVGDNPHADVEGARGAGLHTVWFAGMHPWPDTLARADYEITHIGQVPDLLD